MTVPATPADADRLSRRRLFAADSFFNAQLPPTRVIDTGVDSAPALACFTNATLREKYGHPRISGGWAYAPDVQYAAPMTPRVKVKLWRTGWTAVPKYKRQTAAILAAGVPLDVDGYKLKFERAQAAGDTDLTAVVIQYDYQPLDGGKPITYVWGLWRGRPPTDAEAAEGYALVCSDGERIVDADRSPGWSTLKIPHGFAYNYDTNPYPTDPVLMERFEVAGMQVSASATTYAGQLITRQDIINCKIEHATACAYHAAYVRNAHRKPAQNHDGDVPGAPMVEGMRFDIDPALDIGALNLHPAAEMEARAMQNGYPLMCSDRSGGAFGLAAEAGISDLLPGPYGTKGEILCFHQTATQDEFPYGAMRLLPPA